MSWHTAARMEFVIAAGSALQQAMRVVDTAALLQPIPPKLVQPGHHRQQPCELLRHSFSPEWVFVLPTSSLQSGDQEV